MKKILHHIFGLALLSGSGLYAQSFTESFNDITTLTGAGWSMQNKSSPLGITNWSQGVPIASLGPFNSYDGATNAYISANFNNTTGSTGTISNWLITPSRTFKNGDVVSFYTRTTTGEYADRLELRLSTAGTSTNVGTTATGTGDFTTLLTSINPNLTTTGYPVVWTQYTVTISGLSAPTTGRLAFRYYVINAGPLGTYSDYIGIDNFVYTAYVCPTITVAAPAADTNVAMAYSHQFTQTGTTAATTYTVSAGALPPGLTLSASGLLTGTPTTAGDYAFTITVTDANIARHYKCGHL